MITRKAKHGCEFCNERQQSLIRLRVHKRMYHLSEGSLCPFCSSMFPDKMLSKHVSSCQKKLKDGNEPFIIHCKEKDSALKLHPRLPKLPPEKIQVDWSSLLAHVAKDCEPEPESEDDPTPMYNDFELPIKSISVQDGFHIIDLESSDEAKDECEIRRRSLRSSGKLTSFFKKTDETEVENPVPEVARKLRKRIRESVSSGEETATKKTAKQPIKRIRVSERLKTKASLLVISDSDSHDPSGLVENVPSHDEETISSKTEEESIKNLTIRLNRAPVTTMLPSSEDGDLGEAQEEESPPGPAFPLTRPVSDDDNGNDIMSDFDPEEPVYCAPANPIASDSSDTDEAPVEGRQHKRKALKKLRKVREMLNSSSEEIVSDSDSDVLLSMSDTSESSEHSSYELEPPDEEDKLSYCSSDCSDAESEISNADSRFLTLNCLSKSEQESRPSRRSIPPFASLFLCFIIDPCNSEITPPLPPPDALPNVRMFDNEQLSVSCICDVCGLITRKPLQKHKLTVHATMDFARCCHCLGLIPPPLYPLHTTILCNTRPGTYGTLLMMKQTCNLCNPPLELRNPYLLLWHAIKEHSSKINENGNRFMCPECGGTFMDYFIECHSKICKYAATVNTPLSALVGYSWSCKEAVETVRKLAYEREKAEKLLQLKVKERAMISLKRSNIELKKKMKLESKKKQRSPSENIGNSEVQKHVEKSRHVKQVLKSNSQSNLPLSKKIVSDQLEVVACHDQDAGSTEPPTPVQKISPQKPQNDTSLVETLNDKLKAASNEIKIDERGICKDFSTLFLYNIFDPMSPPSLSDAEPDDTDEDENGSGSPSEEDVEVSLNINSKPLQDDKNEQNNGVESAEGVDANGAPTDANAVEDQVKNDNVENEEVAVEQTVEDVSADLTCTDGAHSGADDGGKDQKEQVEANEDVAMLTAASGEEMIQNTSEVETNLDRGIDVTSEEKSETLNGTEKGEDKITEPQMENMVNGEKECLDTSASEAVAQQSLSNSCDTAIATHAEEIISTNSANGTVVEQPHSNSHDTEKGTDINDVNEGAEQIEVEGEDAVINGETPDLTKGIDATANITVPENGSTTNQEKGSEPNSSSAVVPQDAQVSSEVKDGTQPSNEVLQGQSKDAKSAKPYDDEDDVVIIDIERHVKPFSDLICEFCGKDTSKVNSLINHKRRNHKDGMRCPLCLSAIPKSLLYCHRRIFCPNLHGKVNWNLKCCMCSCQQQTPFHLLRHAMVIHPKNITKSREEKADPNEPPRVRCEHCAAPVRPIFLDCHQEICLRKLRYEMKARPTKVTSANEMNDEIENNKVPLVIPKQTASKPTNERSHADVKNLTSSSKFSIAGSESAKSKETETAEVKSSHESEEPEMNIDWLVEKMLVEQGNLQMSCAEGESESVVINDDTSQTKEVEEKTECFDKSDPQPPTLVANVTTENCFDETQDSNAVEGQGDERALFLPSSTPLYQMDNSTVDAPYTEDDLPDVGCIESPIKLAEVPSPIRLPDTFRSPEVVQGPSSYQSPVKRRVTRLSVRKSIDKDRERKSAVNVPMNNACEEMNMNIDLDESVLEPTASDEAMLEDISEVLEAVMREENGHGLE